jgi:3-deoxy-D-manno-octulosonic-acid transferase
LNTFRKVYPQSQSEARRYREVGLESEKLGSAGNLKFDAASCPPRGDELNQLRQQLGLTRNDIVMLAGSTHPGEEEMVLEAFDTVRRHFSDAKLMVVPRHPTRGDEVAALARRDELRVQQFSKRQTSERWDVLVVDAMGVLSRLYHVASVAFVGGSLVSKGGQNPLESAAAGCPVMFGSDMTDFPDIAAWLLESSAAQEVSDGAMLGERWLHVLSHPDVREHMHKECLRVVEEHRGAVAMIANEIVTLVTHVELRNHASREA